MFSHLELGLDATYTLDPRPTGVAIYSQEMLRGLAAIEELSVRARYRPNRFLRSFRHPLPPGVRRGLLFDSIAPRDPIFHGLNQRLPHAKRGRFVATFHDLFVMTAEYSTPEFRARFTRFAHEAAERADRIIAVSEFTANQVSGLLNVQRSRIHVIHHGVRPPLLPRQRTPEPMILHVGAIQKRKNVAGLVDAFRQAPPGWRLVLAGGSGYGAEQVFDKIAKSPRRDDITVTGYAEADALEDLYARASIFAFPSFDEGFGIPIIEAMVRGIPVVCSNRSASREVAGDAALLIDPSDSDQLGDGLRRLAADTALQAQLSAAGLARSSLFSWDQAVRETVQLYGEL